MKKLLTISTILLYTFCSMAQQKMTMTLDDAIKLSESKSLQAFLLKNYYMVDYWQYRQFKANSLPEVSLSSLLASYSNASNLRYNSVTQSDEFVQTQNLSQNVYLNVKQKVPFTGGTISLNSGLKRLQSFGDQGYIQYLSQPIWLGYSQSLFGFNSLKWERKSESLEFEKSKKEYIENREAIKLSTVSYFFSLAIAEQQLEVARFNAQKTDTLYNIAKQRFQLGTITKSDILDLELNRNNNHINVQEAEITYREARQRLITYLRLPKEVDFELILPESIPELEIQMASALSEVMSNNPDILSHKLSIIYAQQLVAQRKAAKRFNANLNLNVGINKNDGAYDYANDQAVNGTIPNVYKPRFEDNQNVNVSLTVPILDWGKSKGAYQMAVFQEEVAQIQVEQQQQELEQTTVSKVLGFNIQKNKVQSAIFSDSLAFESYNLSYLRFQQGKVDVLKLVTAQNSKDNAHIQYISALREYWYRYYEIRQLTLFDFETNQEIDVDFDKLIER